VRLLWQAWTAYVSRAAAYQSVLLLNVAYFVVLGPSALAARLFGARLLDLDHTARHTYWLERPAVRTTRVVDLRRQF
jgi:hypothetical protein